MFYPERKPDYRAQRMKRADDVNQAVAASVGGIIETPRGGIPTPSPYSKPAPTVSTMAAQCEPAFSDKPGYMTVEAIRDMPLIGPTGQPAGSVFDVVEAVGRMLIDAGDAKRTYKPVWVATLHVAGVLVRTRLDPAQKACFNVDKHIYELITRETPKLVPFEEARALVERDRAAMLSSKWPYSATRILTTEQAASWDPASLPPDPRNHAGGLVDPKDAPSTPRVKVKALCSCMIGGRIRVSANEIIDIPEPDAVLGSFLGGRYSADRKALCKQCDVIGQLSNRGQRYREVLGTFDADQGGRWSTQSFGFPQYANFSDSNYQPQRKAEPRVRSVADAIAQRTGTQTVVGSAGTAAQGDAQARLGSI